MTNSENNSSESQTQKELCSDTEGSENNHKIFAGGKAHRLLMVFVLQGKTATRVENKHFFKM